MNIVFCSYCNTYSLMRNEGVTTMGDRIDKVWMYEEMMTNNDNLESSLLTSSLLKM